MRNCLTWLVLAVCKVADSTRARLSPKSSCHFFFGATTTKLDLTVCSQAPNPSARDDDGLVRFYSFPEWDFLIGLTRRQSGQFCRPMELGVIGICATVGRCGLELGNNCREMNQVDWELISNHGWNRSFVSCYEHIRLILGFVISNFFRFTQGI